MSHSASGAGRRDRSLSVRPAPSRATRAWRGLQWLVAALMLCEWRFPPPRILLSEQRSALSARGAKRCRGDVGCTAGKLGTVGARVDSLTYLASIGEGATLRRWPDDDMPITVWIADAPGSPARSAARRAIARDAFHTWTNAGVPERFSFVPDSASAMVHVLWRKQLPDLRAGQVTRQADSEGWLHTATVELSVRNMSGAIQDTSTLRAVSLHEVGHLLGLEHSPDERDIMAPWVVARQLSPRDRATARALYGIDPTLPAR
ncbi:MAG: matrixin family metalloprotease [bacterium]